MGYEEMELVRGRQVPTAARALALRPLLGEDVGLLMWSPADRLENTGAEMSEGSADYKRAIKEW